MCLANLDVVICKGLEHTLAEASNMQSGEIVCSAFKVVLVTVGLLLQDEGHYSFCTYYLVEIDPSCWTDRDGPDKLSESNSTKIEPERKRRLKRG